MCGYSSLVSAPRARQRFIVSQTRPVDPNEIALQKKHDEWSRCRAPRPSHTACAVRIGSEKRAALPHVTKLAAVKPLHRRASSVGSCDLVKQRPGSDARRAQDAGKTRNASKSLHCGPFCDEASFSRKERRRRAASANSGKFASLWLGFRGRTTSTSGDSGQMPSSASFDLYPFAFEDSQNDSNSPPHAHRLAAQGNRSRLRRATRSAMRLSLWPSTSKRLWHK